MIDLKTQILNHNCRTIHRFKCEGLPFDLLMRSWSVAEVNGFSEWSTKFKDSPEALARIAQLSLCDESGNLLFTTDDVTALMDKGLPFLNFIGSKFQEINGLSESMKKDFRKEPETK